MGESIVVGSTGEFQDGAMKKVSAAGQDILLARVGGSYYAVSNRCPHLGGDLSKGTLEGSIVTCPRHGSQFDVTNGKNVRWLKGAGLFSAVGKVLKSPQSLKSYPVKVAGDTISVEV